MDKTAEKRFWPKVVKTDACWNWVGAKSYEGYGLFWFRKRLDGAHRYSYTFFKQEIPDGFTIDHLCLNHSCVNPDHLEAVSNRENTLRGNSKSSINARKTHCLRGHPFNEENTVLSIQHGDKIKRQCKVCRRARDNKRNRVYT